MTELARDTIYRDLPFGEICVPIIIPTIGCTLESVGKASLMILSLTMPSVTGAAIAASTLFGARVSRGGYSFGTSDSGWLERVRVAIVWCTPGNKNGGAGW